MIDYLEGDLAEVAGVWCVIAEHSLFPGDQRVDHRHLRPIINLYDP